VTRGIKITTKEKKLLESYENGKCPSCKPKIIYNVGNAIICPVYDYVLECECGDGNSCKYCVENKTPNPEIYWCGDCEKGYDFKERYVISRNKMKPKGTQTTIEDDFHNESQS